MVIQHLRDRQEHGNMSHTNTTNIRRRSAGRIAIDFLGRND
jgi:hypothetical protein